MAKTKISTDVVFNAAESGLYAGEPPTVDMTLPETHTIVPTLADHGAIPNAALGVDAVNASLQPSDADLVADVAAGESTALVHDETLPGTIQDGLTAETPQGLGMVDVPTLEGVDEVDDYNELTVPQLKAEAKARGLTGLSQAAKPDLVAALEANDAESEEAAAEKGDAEAAAE